MAFRSSNSTYGTGGGGGGGARRTNVHHTDVLLNKDADLLIPAKLEIGRSNRFRILPCHENGVETEHTNPDAAAIMEAWRAANANVKNRSDPPFGEIVDGTIYVNKLIRGIGLEDTYTYFCGSRTDFSGKVVEDGWSITDVVVNRLASWVRLVEQLIKGAGLKKGKQAYEYIKHNYPNIPAGVARYGAYLEYPVASSSVVGVAQAFVFEVDGNEVQDTAGNPSMYTNGIVLLNTSSMHSLITGITTPVSKREPCSLRNNVLGDFCSNARGKIVMQTREEQTKYNIRLLDEYPLQDFYWRPWEQIIKTPCIEEQLEMLIAGIGEELVAGCLLHSESYVDYLTPEQQAAGSSIPDLPDYKKSILGNSAQGAAPSGKTLACSFESGKSVEISEEEAKQAYAEGREFFVYDEPGKVWVSSLVYFKPTPPPPPTRPTPPPPPTKPTPPPFPVPPQGSVPPPPPAAQTRPATPPPPPAAQTRPATPPPPPAAERSAPPARPVLQPPPPPAPAEGEGEIPVENVYDATEADGPGADDLPFLPGTPAAPPAAPDRPVPPPATAARPSPSALPPPPPSPAARTGGSDYGSTVKQRVNEALNKVREAAQGGAGNGNAQV